jgi:hypothetical protein
MQGGNAAYAEEVKQEQGRNWDRMSHGVWQKSMVSIKMRIQCGIKEEDSRDRKCVCGCCYF